MLVGLTGGMGCGKSTVASYMEDAGWLRVDSDACVRQLLVEDRAIIQSIADRYGSEVLLPEGTVNRKALAGLVFRDSEELDWLERLLHPPVRALWQSQIAKHPDRRRVVEIPLLFEKKLEKDFDITVAVVCSPGKQLARLVSRGISEEQVRLRMARQLPTMEKANLARVVIFNEGSPFFLNRQVRLLMDALAMSGSS